MIIVVGKLLRICGIKIRTRFLVFNFISTSLYFLKKSRQLFITAKGERIVSKNFSKYYFKNSDHIKIKTENLKRNLDYESQNLIDSLVLRYLYLAQTDMLDYSQFSLGEIEDQKKISKFVKKFERRYLNIISDSSILYFCHGLKFVPDKIIKEKCCKDCIDGGAYRGESAIVFNKFFNFRKIYCFEPEKENFYYLDNNIGKYRIKNAVPVRKGIGEKKKKVIIINSGDSSSISERGDEEIEIISIDNFVKENNCDVGVIKMDVEGYEYFALQGALETIKKYKPILLISIYHNGRDFFEIKPFLEEKFPFYTFMIRKLYPFSLIAETYLIGFPE